MVCAIIGSSPSFFKHCILMLTNQGYDIKDRLRSYELIAELASS